MRLRWERTSKENESENVFYQRRPQQACGKQCGVSGSVSSSIRTLLALLDPDRYILYGSGSSNLKSKTDHKLKHLEYL